MKSLNKNIFIFLLIIGLASCTGLDDLAPINEIPSDTAFASEASATAALNGVYDRMQDGDLVFDGWLALPQFFSDEGNATGTFPTRLEFGNLNVFPANGTMATVFTEYYITINNANNVIAGVPNVVDESFTAEERTDYVAQAKMIRGQIYLHLVSLWGEVPLIVSPTIDVGDVLNVPKSSVADIYAQITKDLTDASNGLLAATSSKRVSQQAAKALLARLNLYQGNWQAAIDNATAALGDPNFSLVGVPYLADVIYQLAFTATDGNVLNFFYGPSDFGGRYSIGPSATFMNAFETGDPRFLATIDTSSAAVPFGVKYPDFAAGISGTATDPIFFVRHAEMVLIIAEAYAEMGDFTNANAWFNQVRQRVSMPDKTLDASNFVDMILQERFVEFGFEGPFRLIDLRRKGKALEVLGPIGYEACDDAWPLPQREVDRNTNLTQNACCNC